MLQTHWNHLLTIARDRQAFQHDMLVEAIKVDPKHPTVPLFAQHYEKACAVNEDIERDYLSWRASTRVRS